MDEIHDFTASENEHEFLEGTVSMVLNRENKICYACISPRADLSLLEHFCTNLNYQPIHFIANNIFGKAIHHNYVVMSITSDFIIVRSEYIYNKVELAKIFASTKKQIAFNVLEVLSTYNIT